MSFKAVIFDLDGTLLNTLEDLSDSVNLVLDMYEYPQHTLEEYRLIIGNGAKNLMEKSLPQGVSPELVDEALSIYKNTYREHFADKTRPYEGICDMLTELNKCKIKISVCSNKHNDAVVSLVNLLLPKDVFVCIQGDCDGIPRKPDPTSSFDMARKMGVSPKETVYVGDSMVDMLTAKNAGMLPVGVLWGFRGKEELVDNGASVLLENPSELMQKVLFDCM